MNERFMFRVWYKKDKQYLDPDYYEGFYMSPDGVVRVGITEWNGICDNYQEIPQEQLIIEQCTGLKDKNGKLIFEGDVFEATVLNSFDGDEMIDKRIRGQVAYYADEAAFTFAAYSPVNLGELEIIGNIHEMELEK